MNTTQEADGQAVKPYVENIDSLREAVENARGLFRLLYEARAFNQNDGEAWEAPASEDENEGVKRLIFEVSENLMSQFLTLNKQDSKLRDIARGCPVEDMKKRMSA